MINLFHQMKLQFLLLSLFFMFTFAGSLSAQTNWGSIGLTTVSLTLTFEQQTLPLKDEFGKILTGNDADLTFANTYTVTTLSNGNPIKSVSTNEVGGKWVAYKWGNAEIIRLLVESGSLEQKGRFPYVAGWSIYMIYDVEGRATGTVARHTDKTTIPINLALVWNAGVRAISAKTVVTDNTPLVGAQSRTETRSFNSALKGPGTATVPYFDGNTLSLFGQYSGGGRVTPKIQGTGVNRVTTFVYTNNAQRLSTIVGGSEGFAIEGSISVAAGVIVDLDVFNAGSGN